MKTAKRFIALVLLLTLLGQLLAGCAEKKPTVTDVNERIDLSTGFSAAPDKGELEKISENDRFILYANLSNGEAAVEDKQQKVTWYTNPVDRSEDAVASGMNKNRLQSVLAIQYQTWMDVTMECAGFLSSVRKEGLSYRLEDDGSIIFLFDFPNESITVPVRYALDPDGFVAEILSYGVREYGKNKLLNVDFLPFFGAGGLNDTGYMLVPDGCGALIRYNNNRIVSEYYGQDDKYTYGNDSGVKDYIVNGKATRQAFAIRENPFLPIFGVSRNDVGYFAVVTQGAARSTIRANVAMRGTSYNTAWSLYNYRFLSSYQITDKNGITKFKHVAEINREDWENYRVKYFFLERGKNEYANMAELYRGYLMENQGLEARVQERENIPLYLELYGYIKKTKSFMGIPADVQIPLTTLEDANAILDKLEGMGIGNVVVKYDYWAKNSYFDKIPTGTSVNGKVGTATELQQLQSRLENSGGLYLSADLINVYKTGNGVGRFSDVLRSISGAGQRIYKLNPLLLAPDTRYDPWYLLRPSAVTKVFGKFSANMKKAGYHNLALDTVGELLYGELSASGIGRDQMTKLVSEALSAISQEGQGLMITGGNDYAAVYANHILETSSQSSGFDIEDESVPFYQMVMHGMVSYSLSPTNLASNPQDMTLKCLEFGANPLFCLIGRNGDELIGSRSDDLYSVSAENWLDFLHAQYDMVNEVLKKVQTSMITDHRIHTDKVRSTTYENGITIYVNYGDKDATVDGVLVPARGCAVTENGNVMRQMTMAEAA